MGRHHCLLSCELGKTFGIALTLGAACALPLLSWVIWDKLLNLSESHFFSVSKVNIIIWMKWDSTGSNEGKHVSQSSAVAAELPL